MSVAIVTFIAYLIGVGVGWYVTREASRRGVKVDMDLLRKERDALKSLLDASRALRDSNAKRFMQENEYLRTRVKEQNQELIRLRRERDEALGKLGIYHEGSDAT